MASKPIRVRATAPGFYGGSRRRRGDEFDVAEERHVGKWMVRVDAGAEGADAGDAAGAPAPKFESKSEMDKDGPAKRKPVI